MTTLDFTFSIPVTLPTQPLEATGVDEVAVAQAKRVVSRTESEVMVNVSPSARARANMGPSFGAEVEVDEGDNEDRSTAATDDQSTATGASGGSGLSNLAARVAARLGAAAPGEASD